MNFAVLTGAGASYGAGKIIPHPPPLGNSLYKELSKSYPRSWGNLPWQYAGVLRKDFERGMELIWNNRLDWVQEMMVDMACYFSEFNPSNDGTDCYSQLVSTIAEEKLFGQVAFATLNYECVLDVTAIKAGMRVTYAPSLPLKDKLTIWKLHGACNLLPKANVHDMSIGARSIYDGPVAAVELPMVRKRYHEDSLALPPLMCVYMPGKPTQSAKKQLTQIRQAWADWAIRSDVIAVIGARPNLTENYIWQPIIDSNAEILYVGGKDGDYKQLQTCLSNRFKHVAFTFTEGINDLLTILRNKG